MSEDGVSITDIIDQWMSAEPVTAPQPAHHGLDPVRTFTAAELRQRGWSDASIRRFAGPPAYLVPNPAHPAGAPMRLWAEPDIVDAENSDRFRQWRTRYHADQN